MNLLHKVPIPFADIATAQISAQSAHRLRRYGTFHCFWQILKEKKCHISVTSGPIGPNFGLWQYLQSILGPYEENSSSDRTPSMRKWVSTFCVICPCSVSLHGNSTLYLDRNLEWRKSKTIVAVVICLDASKNITRGNWQHIQSCALLN